MIELLNVDNSIEKPIYATNNVYDIVRYIDGRKEDVRILYDPDIKYWFIGDASIYIHYYFALGGWKNGLYSDKDIKAEKEFNDYFHSRDNFLYLYFYKDKPLRENLTGDYSVHYFYDFGILDSHDILKLSELKYEDTELYKILSNRLIKTEIEQTKRMEARDGFEICEHN